METETPNITSTTSTVTSATTVPTPPERVPINNRTEIAVGIECFLGKHKTWTGILKQRYDDFIVNEIDLNGNVVHLNQIESEENKEKENNKKVNETAIVDEEQQKKLEQEKEEKEQKRKEELKEAESELEKLVGTEETVKFSEFINTTLKEKPKSSFLFKEISEKDKRAGLHRIIKEKFKLLSETENSCIKVISPSGNFDKRSNSWPKERPRYLQFVLFKENKESIDALNILSRTLKVNQKIFSTAGTKDKRGVTTQNVTVFKVAHDRLLGANRRLFGIKVGGDFKYVHSHLQLGDLTGNRFTVVIRDISADDQLVQESVEELRQTGFINYYGLQRFGTGSISTHEVGKAIIKGEWENVVKLILYPREGEKPELTAARQNYKDTGNVDALMRALPKFMNAELTILRGLKRDKRAFQNAVDGLPRTLKMLYPHSYQSYVWNRMASERIKLFGFDQPVVGDLVAIDIEKKPVAAQQQEINDNDNGENNMDDLEEEELQEEEEQEFQIHVVSEDDVKEKRYSMSQVVLPMVGVDIQYPTHKIGELYKQVIAEDNITEKNFNNKTKLYNLKGSYRKLLSYADNIEYKTFRYDDYTKSLTLNDLERLNGKQEPADQPNGKFKALRVSFNLPTSSYATMVYRELLKLTSDFAPQVAMGEYSKQSILKKDETTTTTTNTETTRKEEDINNNDEEHNKKRKMDEMESKTEEERVNKK